MFIVIGDHSQTLNRFDTRKDNSTKEQILIPQNEFSRLDECENETELELHDYVNLQECHEMMNMHQPLFDPKFAKPNHQGELPLDNHVTTNETSPFFQNEIFCNSCKNV